MLKFDEIKKYWDDRAAGDRSAQSTTQDYYLRTIESRVLAGLLARIGAETVADVGCGDGRTTGSLASIFPKLRFSGFDYSGQMIATARSISQEAGIGNVTFAEADICNSIEGQYDALYTTRCLINVPSWEGQKAAIKNLHGALHPGGHYFMVENFIEGHNLLNGVRRQYGLPEIAVRNHNLFFERSALLDYVREMFDVVEETNISSTYYLVSRVIYSKMCADAGTTPDYFDDHHRLAAELPFSGEFGPVRLLCLKKKG